ncbi:MAG: hypothetical protein AAGD13_23950 [Pseudomonadota bacterium]
MVFFVGNSFTRQHDIPAQVCRIAEAASVPLYCHRRTANGAKLYESVFFAQAITRERGSPVPGTLVLQDHSLEPVTPEGRRRSADAIAIYAAQFEKTVIQETWPRRAGHRLYTEAGMPKSPDDMTALVRSHYAAQARRTGARVAPVALAWQRAIADGHELHARDGYHANETGARLTALVLAAALGVQIEANDALAEIAATTPT